MSGLPDLVHRVQRYLSNDNDSTNTLRHLQHSIAAKNVELDVNKPWKKRIVAVGDLHGDLAHALRVLRAASIVDHRAKWIGKTATLVQTGDIVDRGKDTIALYRLFDLLREQAAEVGGEVISLLGNHEVCVVLKLESLRLTLFCIQFMNGTNKY